MTGKPKIPWPYWPFWMFCLALGLFVYYVLLTPLWMGIRFVSWLAERFGGPGRPLGPAA